MDSKKQKIYHHLCFLVICKDSGTPEDIASFIEEANKSYPECVIDVASFKDNGYDEVELHAKKMRNENIKNSATNRSVFVYDSNKLASCGEDAGVYAHEDYFVLKVTPFLDEDDNFQMENDILAEIANCMGYYEREKGQTMEEFCKIVFTM